MAEDDHKQASEEATDPGPPARPRLSWRRRLAFPILVLGIAGLAAYWSRSRPVKVEVTYDLGPQAARVSRLSLTYQQQGKGLMQPVEWTFPPGATVKQKRRHTIELRPGTYTVRARMHLRAQGGREAEVRKLTRRIKVSGGEDQRITIRFR